MFNPHFTSLKSSSLWSITIWRSIWDPLSREASLSSYSIPLSYPDRLVSPIYLGILIFLILSLFSFSSPSVSFWILLISLSSHVSHFISYKTFLLVQSLLIFFPVNVFVLHMKQLRLLQSAPLIGVSTMRAGGASAPLGG